MARRAAATGPAAHRPHRVWNRPSPGVYTAGASVARTLIMLTALAGRERTRDQLEALMGSCGYTLVRDTPIDRILPWRVLEFQHMPG